MPRSGKVKSKLERSKMTVHLRQWGPAMSVRWHCVSGPQGSTKMWLELVKTASGLGQILLPLSHTWCADPSKGLKAFRLGSTHKALERICAVPLHPIAFLGRQTVVESGTLHGHGNCKRLTVDQTPNRASSVAGFQKATDQTEDRSSDLGGLL